MLRSTKWFLPALFIILVNEASAQERILVKWNGSSAQFPQRAQSSPRSLPLELIFTPDFSGKKLSVTTSAGQNISATFNSSDLSRYNGTDSFRIVVNSGGVLQLKGNNRAFADSSFRFSIDGVPSPVIWFTATQKSGAVSQPEGARGDSAFHTSYKPGSVVQDALKLRELQQNGAGSDSLRRLFKLILSAYNLYGSNDSANVFITYELDQLRLQVRSALDPKGRPQSGGSFLASALTAAGNANVTALADGLARFIVKRTKQELSIAFFQKFREHLDTLPDLKGVFPQTHGLLMAIDRQVYDYNNYLNNLRNAFRADLLLVDEHLPAIVANHPDYFRRSAGAFSLGLALRTGCYISASLRQQMHPGDVLESLPLEYFADAPPEISGRLSGLRGALQTLQLLSYAARENDTTKHRYWTGIESFRALAKDRQTMLIFLGLLVEIAKERYDGIEFGNGSSLYNILNQRDVYNSIKKGLDTFGVYRSYVLRLGTRVSELEKLISGFDASAADSVRAESYVRYFESATQLVETGMSALDLPFLRPVSTNGSVRELTNSFLAVGRDATSLSAAIIRKRYAEAVNGLVRLYQDVLQMSGAPQPVAARIGNTSPAAGISGTILSSPPGASIELRDSVKNTLADFVKYGALMANMINAQSSAEVEAAIESVALPAGSARIKRTAASNIAINAYCGLFAGREVILGYDETSPFGGVNAGGLTAPLGVSFSTSGSVLPWPFNRLSKNNGRGGVSSSWFLSLIDIGAVAAFRFGNDAAEQVPTIQLKDIFAPGIYWSVGLPRSPISINLGVQTGSNLRTVKLSGNDFADRRYMRYSLSVLVDIPLLNLATK